MEGFKVCTGVIWLHTGTSGGLLRKQQCTFGLRKMLGVSEQLSASFSRVRITTAHERSERGGKVVPVFN
jgi:hypothetical protein